MEYGIQVRSKVGFARSAIGSWCRQYRRDQRPGCIGQICIVELVDIVSNSHHTTIICTRKRLFKHPLRDRRAARSSRKNQRRRDGWLRSIPRQQSKDGSRFVGVVSAREEADRGKVVNFRGDRKIQFTRGGPLRGDEIGRLKHSEAMSSKPELEHPLLSFVLSVLAQIEGLTKRRC